MILAAFVVVVVVMLVRYQVKAHSSGDGGGAAGVSDSAAAVQQDQVVPAPAKAASSPSPSATGLVDLPQFDRAGSGSACTMTYAPDTGAAGGGTVTVFNLARAGELVTHLSGGSGGLQRHDEREDAGPVVFRYDVPLSQVTDMGAVLYLADGTQQSCTISAGNGTP